MTTTGRRKLLYWLSTGAAALAFTAVGAADLLRAPRVVEGLSHLGYPEYFPTIIGVWQLLGAAAIIAPGNPPLYDGVECRFRTDRQWYLVAPLVCACA